MGTFDTHQMGWKLKEDFIPGNAFNSVTEVDGVSWLVGGQHAELSSFDYGGITMDDSDGVATIMRIPWDMDVTKEMYLRLHFTSDAADPSSDTIDWDATYKFFAVSTSDVWAALTGDGTLAWDQQTMTLQYTTEVTPWLPMLFTTNYAAGDLFLGIRIVCTAHGGTADEVFFMGMEMKYTLDPQGAERKTTSVG